MFSRCYEVITALWAGVLWAVADTGKHVGAFAANAVEAIARQREAFERIKTILIKGLLYALIPVFLAFILAIILLSKICRYAYKWLSYVITALKAILVVIGESRSAGNNQLNETIEFTGFTYDPEQDMFYSNMDAWQRNFGYCRLYDEASAPMGMIVDCEPIYFEYDEKNWLIELWKGQYDLTTGCEIGVYTTEGPSLDIPGVFNGTFFNSGSNEDLLQMSYSLNKNNKVLFTREDKHWWLTGFKLGEFSKPSELTMKVNITLKDQTMCSAFMKGLSKAGYQDNGVSRYGNTVSFKFGKPNTRQPVTRTKLTDWIIQKKNKYLCAKYQDITGTYDNMQDKLKAIQEKAPKMYGKIINIGKVEKLYKNCKTINNYFN